MKALLFLLSAVFLAESANSALTGWHDATVVRVVDGDTVDLNIQLGYRVSVRERIRLYGIDAPELTGENKVAGLISKAALENILASGRIVVHGGEREDSFGRWLADVAVYDTAGHVNTVSNMMLTGGYAVKAADKWK